MKIKANPNPPLWEGTPSGQDMQMASLREAIRQEETTRPPMPSDINARLMQRVEKEVNKAKRTRSIRIWPWVAAACVAAILAVYLTPPKNGVEDVSGTRIAKVEKDSSLHQIDNVGKEKPQQFIANNVHDLPQNTTCEEPHIKQMAKVSASQEESLTAQAEVHEEINTEGEPASESQLATAIAKHFSKGDAYNDDETLCYNDDNPSMNNKSSTINHTPRTLTERDIPITRPENLKYTKEELELMRKQANEAYLKWVELELEISKYNLEQTSER